MEPGEAQRTGMLGIPDGVLQISVEGRGSKVVVFESGAGAVCRSKDWRPVVDALKSEATLFSYYRSGYGRSRVHGNLDDPENVVETHRFGMTFFRAAI